MKQLALLITEFVHLVIKWSQVVKSSNLAYRRTTYTPGCTPLSENQILYIYLLYQSVTFVKFRPGHFVVEAKQAPL